MSMDDTPGASAETHATGCDGRHTARQACNTGAAPAAAAERDVTESARAVADGPLEVIDTTKLPQVSPLALLAIAIALAVGLLLILSQIGAGHGPSP